MATITTSESNRMTSNRFVDYGLRRQSAAAMALSKFGERVNFRWFSLKAVSRFACHRSPKWLLAHRDSWKKAPELGVFETEEKGNR